MNKPQKILIILTILLGASLIFFYNKGLQKETARLKNTVANTSPIISSAENPQPKIISTKPDPLEEAVVSATEVIEITFSKPLENTGEFKHKIEPKVDYKLELSQDRKSVKIIPQKPYELGTTYTLFISPESKFDGGSRLDGEKIFHFRTIRYRGV